MERKDATRLAYDEIQMFGMPALFTDWRIIRDTVPKGMTLYELRHEDENWGKPCQLAKRIVVNYYGSILTSLPIQLNPDGGRDINRGDFRHNGERSINIQDFLEKNPVAELDVMNLSTLDRAKKICSSPWTSRQTGATAVSGISVVTLAMANSFFTIGFPIRATSSTMSHSRQIFRG